LKGLATACHPARMLEIEGVSRSYGGAQALSPTTLAFESGRTTVLIGPSGCGKSTLLRLLIGLIAPDGGSIRFDGAPIDSSTLPQIRRRMGYVIQDGGLFPHLSARDNVIVMARHLGWDTARIAARVETLCALTRFPADALGRYPAGISGGQRQRVSLMRALMLDPDVLLLDEPLGALDPMIRADLQSDLRAIFRSLAKTVVLVTHDMGEAAFLGDTIVLLCEGRIVQRGALGDLLRAPADPFVTRFIQAQRTTLDAMEEIR